MTFFLCHIILSPSVFGNPEQCGGRPCVRAMRIRVVDVLDLLANGMSAAQVVDELPDLESDDVAACLRFASRRRGAPPSLIELRQRPG